MKKNIKLISKEHFFLKILTGEKKEYILDIFFTQNDLIINGVRFSDLENLKLEKEQIKIMKKNIKKHIK